jgi:nicotinamide riboside kinase
MRIAITGSHCVGKTTLTKVLVKKLKYNYIPDIVREEAVKKKFPINENSNSEVQIWFFARQWELETITPENWVSDKSLFDYLAYAELVLRDENLKKVIREFVQRNARYDFIFYLPIEFPIKEDGIRSINSKYREEIDSCLKQCLVKSNMKYVTVSGSIQERVKQVLKHIKK